MLLFKPADKDNKNYPKKKNLTLNCVKIML